MRKVFVCLAGVAVISACSKAPSAAPKPTVAVASDAAAPAPAPAAAAAPAPAPSGPAVAGIYTANGKPAALTQVTAHKDDPFDDQPVTALVFTAKDQAGDAKAAFDASFGKFGDAIVVRVQPDGTVIGAEILHSGFNGPGQTNAISISGDMSIKDYSVASGQISGRLTSGGPVDIFGQKLEVDLTFHTKAP
jgi:hypothetical protein